MARPDLRTLIGRTLLLVDMLAALAAAAIVLLAWTVPEALGRWDADAGILAVRRAGPLLPWLAVGLVVLHLLYLAYGRRPETPLRHVVSDAPGGAILVGREALESGLRAAGEAVDGIARVRIGLRQRAARRLLVQAQFAVPDRGDIQRASEALRRSLVERFASMVRLPEGTRVDYELEFVGFAGRAGKRPAEPAAAPAPPEADDPFTGPRYPIDADEDS